MFLPIPYARDVAANKGSHKPWNSKIVPTY